VKELKIVIADDSVAIREQLRRSLLSIPGLALLGMAANGTEAITMVRSLKPDLVILDISMPHKSGLDALKEIRRENSSIVIIMFTADRSEILRDACLKMGANFYLDKSQLLDLIDICQGHLLTS
jgi:DNA-binding NarL/FixJ family response regulator